MKKIILMLAGIISYTGFADAALSLRQQVDNTCGACHAQTHSRPPGNFSLASGITAHATTGVVANGSDPTSMVGGDPFTALIIRKPLESSTSFPSMPVHGGIKLSSTNATMVALIDWVSRGAPAGEMTRGNPGTALYPGGDAAKNPVLSYKDSLGADHVIVYVRRKHNPGGFRDLKNSTPGGALYLQRFNEPNTLVGPEVLLTTGPEFDSTDDIQNPVVSLDGSKIAFARKKAVESYWQIWEINSDGTNPRQITKGAGNKVEPFYLPYNPDGTEARAGEGGIGFISDLPDFRDEYETSVALSLFVCDTDGNHQRQIEFNPSHDIHPFIHSSGMLLFSRWEHNEHQGHNFISLLQMTAADYMSAGTGLFGAFGEHRINLEGRNRMSNSYHDPSEILDANYGKTDPDLSSPTYGTMIARSSTRDGVGGSIAGPFIPRLQQSAGGTPVEAPIIAKGDSNDMRDVEPADLADISSVTYRHPRSLLNGLYITGYATALGRTQVYDSFKDATNYMILYSSWSLYTFNLTAGGVLQNLLPLVLSNGDYVDEVTPLVIRPQPPQIAKPIDLTKTSGVFTSGNVVDRNPSDGQPNNLNMDQLSVIRFIRSLQLSQRDVDTGRRKDRGIATQIVGEAPLYPDGSFSAEVPANVPLQFQLIDKSGRVAVSHKPWIHVAPGATERCVGCHAQHDKAAESQTLQARQVAPTKINTTKVVQFNFHQDIQPIFTAKCISCHDSAKITGAAGRKRGLSLVGRDTPSRITESFQSLIGGEYVISQHSRESELMWWLTGAKLDVSTSTAYPTPAASVPHNNMLTPEELTKIANWIDTGINFRVVENDQVGKKLVNDDVRATFLASVWPILETRCLVCHHTGGEGGMAMNIDGSTATAETQREVDDNRLEAVTRRVNFIIPNASILLRKPLPPSISGVSHQGGMHWTKETPEYMTIYNWITASNPAVAAAPPPTDMVNVNSYPNPFRTEATFVYGLTGAAATSVEIKIYSLNGKLIRELTGTTKQSTTVGWNKVEWDGKDKNGRVVGNDVYFYTIETQFGDGVKKRFRGKCVKVN